MQKSLIRDTRTVDSAVFQGGKTPGTDGLPEVVIYHENGEQWEAAPMTDTLKIITFAGQVVPEDGLTLHPPQGGELTIWPDGGYAFTPPGEDALSGGQAAVTTYYSFVMEDIDGETSVGTFALNPEDEHPGAMEDFQAWSLPELLQVEADEANLLLGVGHDIPVDFASHSVDVPVPEMHADLLGGDPTLDDDLTHLLIHSQSS
jgi:hypothetical protein